MTSDLKKRIFEHRNNFISSFSSKYKTYALVYYEIIEDYDSALAREKRLKKWPREWKIKAIEEMNPNWNNLYYDLPD